VVARLLEEETAAVKGGSGRRAFLPTSQQTNTYRSTYEKLEKSPFV